MPCPIRTPAGAAGLLPRVRGVVLAVLLPSGIPQLRRLAADLRGRGFRQRDSRLHAVTAVGGVREVVTPLLCENGLVLAVNAGDDAEDPRPVEEVDQEDEEDDRDEGAEEGAHEDVARVVLVVGDAREADVEGEAEDAELEEGP